MGFPGWKGEVAAAAGLFVAAELKAAADRGSAEAQTDDERERAGRKGDGKAERRRRGYLFCGRAEQARGVTM